VIGWSIKKKNRCRLCGKSNLKKVLKYENSPIGDDYRKYAYSHKKYPIELYLCRNCGLTQLLHVINPKVLYTNYIYKTEHSPDLVKHFKNYTLDISQKLKLKRNKKILEVGSNDGVLLKEFRKRNHKVIGLDPAKKISHDANNQKIKTYNDFLNNKVTKKILKNEGKFDLIISNNVFANVENINNWVKNIKILLKEKGTYIIETYYLYKLLKNKVFDFIYHEHLNSFTIKALQTLFKSHSMKIYNAEVIHTKGGSIRCYITKDLNKKILKNVEKLINKEKKYEIFGEKRFKIFQNEINLLANKTFDYLNKSKMSIKNIKIVGYGASISCTTLIYHFKIQKFLNLIVDDNKAKFNTFLPGSNIKVYSSKKVKDFQPNYIIILAWRFQKTIIKKLKKMNLNKDTKIILPCPTFKVISLKKLNQR
tara:strand:- start:582 stop:1847 length:1266 start_codon:yes stop_codon:yes gene_type:complete